MDSELSRKQHLHFKVLPLISAVLLLNGCTEQRSIPASSGMSASSASGSASEAETSSLQETDPEFLQEKLDAENLLAGHTSVHFQTTLDDGMRAETSDYYGSAEDGVWSFWSTNDNGGCTCQTGSVLYQYENSYEIAAYVYPGEEIHTGMNAYTVLSKVEGEIIDTEENNGILTVTMHYEDTDGSAIDTTYQLDAKSSTLQNCEKVYTDPDGNTTGTFRIKDLILDDAVTMDTTAQEKVTDGEQCSVNFYVDYNGKQTECHYHCNQGAHIFVSTSGNCTYYKDEAHTEREEEPESGTGEATYYAVIKDAE